jgi:hypothetical protein
MLHRGSYPGVPSGSPAPGNPPAGGVGGRVAQHLRTGLERVAPSSRWNRFLHGKKGRAPRRGWLLAAIVALAIYPVVGTFVLSSGLFEKLVASEDLKILLEKPAWTFWPGRVHAAGARILVNGETQFELDAKHLLLDVRFLPLIHKHLHVLDLKADDLRYKMRIQVEDEKGIEKRLAAYPPIPDLPGDPTLAKNKGQATEERQSDFTVEVDGIDAGISDLWFMEYHYVGPGRITGGFLVGPHRMRVGTSVQDFGPGELRFGEKQVIATQFGGIIKAAIPELDPEKHANESFLGLVSSDIALKGNVVTLAHVGAYVPGVRVIGGAGPFATKLVLSKGRLGDSSRLTFSTDRVGIRGNRYGVDTDWDFVANVGKKRRSKRAPRTASSCRACVPSRRPCTRPSPTITATSSRCSCTIRTIKSS